VFTKDGAVLRGGKQVVDNERRQTSQSTGRESWDVRVYRVEQVNGPWLWLVQDGGGARGWVTSDWIVPFESEV
jgi:hypothetical protein